MRHSWYGDLQGEFEGRGWEFFKGIWWLWLLTPIALFIFPLLPFSMPTTRPSSGAGGCPASASAACSVESKLEPSALQGLYWKVIGWSMLLSIAIWHLS